MIVCKPSMLMNRAKAIGASGLVKPSANIEVVDMYSIETTPRSTSSRK